MNNQQHLGKEVTQGVAGKHPSFLSVLSRPTFSGWILTVKIMRDGFPRTKSVAGSTQNQMLYFFTTLVLTCCLLVCPTSDVSV